jgi:hypothetical protein
MQQAPPKRRKPIASKPDDILQTVYISLTVHLVTTFSK